ncbi:MAG TPA: hypothetical protein VJ965_05455, partial [Anaerolineales bacterium]|nr:hypothetical protein [Anaerolineales bacterium]
MASIFEQIFKLLVDPSGSMVYQLVVAFTFISVLQPVLSLLPGDQKAQRRRVLIGVVALIVSRLVLFILALLSILNIDFMAQTLPVAEKVINTLDIAIIVWLFAFQKANKVGDIGLALFGLTILTGGVISTVYWNLQANPVPFTQSSLATGWGVLTLIVLLIGIVTLVTSKTPASIQGIVLCGLLLLTEGLQLLILPEQGDYFPISRLGHLIAFPLLVGIFQNFQVIPAPHTEEDEETESFEEDEEVDFTFSELPGDVDLYADLSEKEAMEETSELEEGDLEGELEFDPEEGHKTQSMPLHIYQNGVAMGGATSSQDICRLFTRFTAHALLADLCLLLT